MCWVHVVEDQVNYCSALLITLTTLSSESNWLKDLSFTIFYLQRIWKDIPSQFETVITLCKHCPIVLTFCNQMPVSIRSSWTSRKEADRHLKVNLLPICHFQSSKVFLIRFQMRKLLSIAKFFNFSLFRFRTRVEIASKRTLFTSSTGKQFKYSDKVSSRLVTAVKQSKDQENRAHLSSSSAMNELPRLYDETNQLQMSTGIKLFEQIRDDLQKR